VCLSKDKIMGKEKNSIRNKEENIAANAHGCRRIENLNRFSFLFIDRFRLGDKLFKNLLNSYYLV
jgi:hypothetical protein